jgi:hypothetical protein
LAPDKIAARTRKLLTALRKTLRAASMGFIDEVICATRRGGGLRWGLRKLKR